jgi:hypothetical protein
MLLRGVYYSRFFVLWTATFRSSIGLTQASLGTETDGGILSPLSVNSSVGIKPIVGLTSRFLVIPISEHQDTVGKGIGFFGPFAPD